MQVSSKNNSSPEPKKFTLYIGKLEITYAGNVTVRLISNTYGTMKLNGKENEKKKFDDNLKIIKDSDLNLDEEDLEGLKDKLINLSEMLNFFSENKIKINESWEKFCKKLKDKYNIEKIEAIDFALEYNQKEDKYCFSEKSGIRIQIPLEDTGKEELKIYDRCCIGLSETGTYDIIVNLKNKEKKDEEKIKIGLGEHLIQKGFITPFGSVPNQAHIDFNGQTFFGPIFIDVQDKGLHYELPLLVFPVKLDTDEAEILVNDLINHWGKVISIKAPTELYYEPGELIKRNPIQTLTLVNEIFENGFNRIALKKVLSAIRSHPDRIIEKRMVEREIQDTQEVTAESITEAIIEGKIRRVVNSSTYHFVYPANSTNYYAFTRIKEEETYISFDTHPNRFLKYFLRHLERVVNSAIEEILKSKDLNNFSSELINKVKSQINRYVSPFLNLDWVKEVSEITFLPPPSQKLLKDIYYSSAFYDYLDLIKNLKLLDEELEKCLRNPVENMPRLYEIWCGIKLNEIPNYEVETQRCFCQKVDKYGYFSYSLPLRPDFVIKPIFVIKNKNDSPLIILDAKYRVDFSEEIQKLEKEDKDLKEINDEEKIGKFVLVDLYKMHTYREAIIKKDVNKRPVWVIALYPGDTLALFSEDGGRLRIEKKKINDNDNWYWHIENEGNLQNGGVGAIPFRPALLDNPEYNEFIQCMFETLKNSVWTQNQ